MQSAVRSALKSLNIRRILLVEISAASLLSDTTFAFLFAWTLSGTEAVLGASLSEDSESLMLSTICEAGCSVRARF